MQGVGMAESIFARVSRLLSAIVEDAVDRMEHAGGDVVMRAADWASARSPSADILHRLVKPKIFKH
jgi:hypothetical protein